LADSTLRSGEPVTWGSGQQLMNRSWATWALSEIVNVVVASTVKSYSGLCSE
jgi:hypothetical protein